MASKRFPGSGQFVVLLDYGAQWVLYCGGNTMESARAHRRRLTQWPDAKVRIVENVIGNPDIPENIA